MAYNSQQIQQAMRAAMAAGDREAVEDLKARLTEAYQAEAPSATEGMSGAQKFAAGMGQGMTNIARQAGNILGGAFGTSDADLQDAAQLDRALLDTGAGKAGAIVGEIAATAPVGGLVANAGRRAGLGLIRAGMAEGAAQGALTAGPGSRLRGATEGAALGGALPGAVRAVQRVARPIAASGDALRLVDADVRLTPGELKPSGALNQWEQALQSSALFGSGIREARDRSMVDFQRAVANRAQAPGASPIGRGVTDVNEMARRTGQGYDTGYEAAIGRYDDLRPEVTGGTFGPISTGNTTIDLGHALKQTMQGRYPGKLITPKMREDIGGAVAEEASALGPRVTGRDLQGVRSNLRAMARDTEVPGERALLRGAEGKVTQSIESQIDPADAAALRALDAKYPEFKILQDVTKRGGDQPGGWTPAQLSQAVRAATDLGEYARGGGRLRTLSKSGRKVFEQRSLPTGERQVTTGVLGKLGLPIAAGVSYGLTKIPTKALVGRTNPQRALAAALRKARRDYGSEAAALEALGTAGLIQAYGE